MTASPAAAADETGLDVIEPPKMIADLRCGLIVEVSPIKTRELPGFARAIEPIGALIAQGDFMGALAVHADKLIEAVCIGARLDRKQVDEFDLDDLLTLAGVVVQVNADFFSRAIAPGLAKILGDLWAVAADEGVLDAFLPGRKSSPGSSPPGTPEPMS